MIFASQRMKRDVELFAKESSGIANRYHKTPAASTPVNNRLTPAYGHQYRPSPAGVVQKIALSMHCFLFERLKWAEGWTKIYNSTKTAEFLPL